MGIYNKAAAIFACVILAEIVSDGAAAAPQSIRSFIAFPFIMDYSVHTSNAFAFLSGANTASPSTQSKNKKKKQAQNNNNPSNSAAVPAAENSLRAAATAAIT
jgi:hypothetical protein